MHRSLSAAFAATLLAAASFTGPQAGRYDVWALDQNGNLLYVLDPEGAVLRAADSVELGNARRPHMLVGVPGDGFVYSANTVSHSVTVLDRATGQVRTVIPAVGKLPHRARA